MIQQAVYRVLSFLLLCSAILTITACELFYLIFPRVQIESIELVAADITDGGNVRVSAVILPNDAYLQNLLWSIDDDTVASISQKGLLVPKKDGSVTIHAAAQDNSGITANLSIQISGTTNQAVQTAEGLLVSNEKQLLAALSGAAAGSRILVQARTYLFTSKISSSKSGTETNNIVLMGNPLDNGRPRFDFSEMSEAGSNRGIELSGSWWHIKGIDVFKAGDNGLFIKGHNNLIEFCSFSECADTGLQIGNGARNNTILNCDSFYNADSSIENADGFACKLDAGTGNTFIGCRAWQNLDDGWDGYLRGADNITTSYINCWAFWNGKLKSGQIGGGDGNGFKTGGSDDKLLRHNAIYVGCIAAGNVVDGFDHNSNRGTVEIYNSAAIYNGANINFSGSNIAAKLVVKNTVAVGSSNSLVATVTELSNNQLSAGTGNFESLDIALLASPRKADGSLPDIAFLQLKSSSSLINAGTISGIPDSIVWTGSAPDIGPFEFTP